MATQERLGFGFLGAPAVPEMMTLAQRAEALGYDSAWVAETRFTRDGIAPVAAIAAATRKIQVGTAIINVYTRNPVVTAISFASLDEISGGRTIMGLGPGSPLILAPQDVKFEKPLTRLREYSVVVQRLLAGEKVTWHGKTMDLDGVQLELAPVRSHIPLYLGVTGIKALELAGEIGDGVLMNAFLPTSYTERAVEAVARGARKADKALAQVELCGCLVVCVDDDSKRAKDQVRPLIALYLSVFPNIARETGLPPEFVAQTRSTFGTQGIMTAAGMISDEVVDSLVVAGTETECRARIAQYRAAGLERPIVFPIDGNYQTALERLAPQETDPKL